MTSFAFNFDLGDDLDDATDATLQSAIKPTSAQVTEGREPFAEITISNLVCSYARFQSSAHLFR
jgi:hypothetical protein